MARWDVRRHKGRSALVLIMVAAPVTLLVVIACWLAIGGVHGEDLIPLRMGSGQALITNPWEYRVLQTAEGDTLGEAETPAKIVPGYVQGRDNTAAIQRLTGGTLIPVAETYVRYVSGKRRILIHGLVLDGRVADLGPKASLTSGRWPEDETEMVVTPDGIEKGLPDEGTVTLLASGEEERVIRVVGAATALNAQGDQPDFVTPKAWDASQAYESTWILKRAKPLLWPEVRALNEYGITVTSAAVLRDPPRKEELAPEVRLLAEQERSEVLRLSALGGSVLFLATTLLVAPAFAVGAARQRRTLALAAINGAETRQLRRSVLAQALILGAAAAFGGALMGAGGMKAATSVWRTTHPGTTVGSFVFPWSAVTIIVSCAVLSALTAALLPSLRLGRLDIVGVMRGQNVSPPANRILPALGALCLGGGGALLISSMRASLDERYSVAGAVILVLGAVLTVPMLLVATGALASRLPVAARMATRDLARHRSRSTPTVAAILAAVATLTAMGIAAASDTEKNARLYLPTTLPGEGYLEYMSGEDAKQFALRTVRREAPGLLITPAFIVGISYEQGDLKTRIPFVTAVAPGSTVERSLDPENARTTLFGTESCCGGQIIALPIDELTRRLRLNTRERSTLAHGGIATIHATTPIHNGVLDMASGTARINEETGEHEDIDVHARRKMPVVQLPANAAKTGGLPLAARGTGALVAIETARKLGWPLLDNGAFLRDPDGAIDAALPEKLDEYLGDEASLFVERGFERGDTPTMGIVFGLAGTLLLAVTLIATALSLAEQQVDMATFAAVGATRGTRRRFAAAHAMTVGLIGTILGIVVGLFAGVAVAHLLTTQALDPNTGNQIRIAPVIAIPWLLLLALTLGVPLVAAALSAAATRRAPTMTRRGD